MSPHLLRVNKPGEVANLKVQLSISRPRNYLKPEYVGKWIEIDYTDRSSAVKALMDAFLVREYSEREIAVLTGFLKRKGLTRAETHAVILHLGYRYNPGGPSLEHMAIDGYCDHKPHSKMGRPKGSKTKKTKQYDWYKSRGF
jgi:hypothetical protein